MSKSGDTKQGKDESSGQQTTAAARMGGGLGVSLGDYIACINECAKLTNPDLAKVCMEGCRDIDSPKNPVASEVIQ